MTDTLGTPDLVNLGLGLTHLHPCGDAIKVPLIVEVWTDFINHQVKTKISEAQIKMLWPVTIWLLFHLNWVYNLLQMSSNVQIPQSLKAAPWVMVQKNKQKKVGWAGSNQTYQVK